MSGISPSVYLWKVGAYSFRICSDLCELHEKRESGVLEPWFCSGLHDDKVERGFDSDNPAIDLPHNNLSGLGQAPHLSEPRFPE